MSPLQEDACHPCRRMLVTPAPRAITTLEEKDEHEEEQDEDEEEEDPSPRGSGYRFAFECTKWCIPAVPLGAPFERTNAEGLQWCILVVPLGKAGYFRLWLGRCCVFGRLTGSGASQWSHTARPVRVD